jgi:hypothetical protein
VRIALLPASRLPSVPAWAAAVAAAWAGGVLVLHAAAPSLPTCRFHALTGVPCPTCGGTRAVASALHGDVLGAFAASPLVFAALLVAASVLLLRVLTARRVHLRLERGEGVLAWTVAGALVAAHWTYLVARGG